MITGVLVVTLMVFTFSFNITNASGVFDVFTAIFAPLIDMVTMPFIALTSGKLPNVGDIIGGPVGGLVACNAFNADGVYFSNCGGAGGQTVAFALIGTSNVVGCGIPVTFYIPQMNDSAKRGTAYTTTYISQSEGAPPTAVSTPIETCLADPNSIDETQRSIAIYRYIKPNTISDRDRSAWFFNEIKSIAGDGFISRGVNMVLHSNLAYLGVPTPGVYLDYYTSGAPQLLETGPYSKYCHLNGAGANECRFLDTTAPADSNVAYVAKIIGSYTGAHVVQTPIMGEGGIEGYSESVACASGQNKFLTTSPTSTDTLWPYANYAHDYSYGNLVAGPYNTTGLACFAPGACGADNGATLSAAPTQLCTGGTPSAISGNGPWTWECSGNNVTKQCSADVVAPTVTLNGPGSITIPGSIGLSWNTQNANSCVASGSWSGTKNVNGSETVLQSTTLANRGTRDYTLTCYNGSKSTKATASVTIKAVPICSFTASSNSVTPPQSATLTWDCSYANSCSINSGVGTVNARSGSVTVRPTATTTYTLTCSSSDASMPFTQTINVGSHPRIREVNP